MDTKCRRPVARELLAKLLFVAIGIGCVGCGGSGEPVGHLHGKVTINGQPVHGDAEGRITFAADATSGNRRAKPSVAPIVNGEYDAEDVPIGKVVVLFDVKQYSGKVMERGIREFKDLVPATSRSGTTIDVAEGSTEKDFAL
jgi:hypothetical protein